MTGTTTTRRTLVASAAALATFGLLGGGAWLAGAARVEARTDPPGRVVAPRGPLPADEQNNIAVFKAASPSVVNITALGTQRDLFSLNVQQVPRGSGTGFVWDERGHIVTNYHVIQGASAARVTLADQSSHHAELVGAFPDRDLAVLRIDAAEARRAAPEGRDPLGGRAAGGGPGGLVSKLPPLPLGTSRELQVGQRVFALGNPFGLDQTLTTGIVSALGREIESVTRRTIRGVIQTDAAINPGNSGGPLLDSAGRLIGVTTAIYSPSGGSAGIGFAIPVDEVNRIVPRLIRDGRIVRPALGISSAPPSVNTALQLPAGVALLGVTAGGPAQRAGLEPFRRDRVGRIVQGDVITAVNGEPVADIDDLLNALERHRPGDSVTLSVQRAGQQRRVSVALAESSE